MVVHYKSQYFPGIVTEIVKNENDTLMYKINAFERFTQKWRWPVRKDEIFYEEKDVIKVIEGAGLIPCNKRRIFKILDSLLLEKWDSS